MPVANSAATANISQRRHHHGRSSRLRPATAAAASVPLPKPIRWYVNWVRANEENAQSLERLSRTFAMIVSDPSDLINMEGCWTVSKLHTFVNETILQTSYRAITASEALTYILKAIRELEGLGELLLRKYCKQATTWNVLLALQSVKCVLNMCVHQQLFLMPWVWHSIRVYLRRVLRVLWIPRYLLTTAAPKSHQQDADADAVDVSVDESGNAVSNQLHGQTVGPNGTRLIIPRVVSSRRSEHRHYYNPNSSSNGLGVEEDGGRAEEQDEAVAQEKEEAEAVPFTLIDVLGMVVDAFLLVRPVLVVAAARRAFPAEGGEDIAKVPDKPKKQPKPTPNPSGAESPAAEPVPKTPLTREEKRKAAEEAALQQFSVLRVTMEASTAQQTLFASWKWWGIFAALDAFVVLVSRYIRSHRIPVVYMEDPPASQALPLLLDRSSSGNSSGGDDGGEENGAVRQGDGDGESTAAAQQTDQSNRAEHANGDNGGAATETNVAPDSAVVAVVPAVVSRDSLRLQQAMRNMGYTFLRDPFFTIVLKRFIYNHFVNGFINRIPLFGSLVAFQVGYFLSMQHFSFLYSLGQ